MVTANRLNAWQNSGHVLDKWVVEYCSAQKAYHVCTLRDSIEANIELIKKNVTRGNVYRIIAIADTREEAYSLVENLKNNNRLTP